MENTTILTIAVSIFYLLIKYLIFMGFFFQIIKETCFLVNIFFLMVTDMIFCFNYIFSRLTIDDLFLLKILNAKSRINYQIRFELEFFLYMYESRRIRILYNFRDIKSNHRKKKLNYWKKVSHEWNENLFHLLLHTNFDTKLKIYKTIFWAFWNLIFFWRSEIK